MSAKRWVVVVLVALLVIVAVVGIVAGGGGGSGAEDTNGPGSFVGRASNAVMFVQWTRAGETVTGSLREAITKTPAGSGVSVSDHAFTGTIHGNGVTLDLGGAEGTYVGEISGEAFDLTLPGRAGSLIKVEFAPGEVTAYNEATRQLLLSEYTAPGDEPGQPCSLYVVGHEAHVEFTGSAAAEECAALVQKQPSVEWTTEQQANTVGQPVACELVNRGNEAVKVTDEGSQYYGGLACKQLSGEGWG